MFLPIAICFVFWLVGKGFFKSRLCDWLLGLIIIIFFFNLLILDNMPK